MAMYLGDKPVKAIMRSRNNLFDISKVTGIRSYAKDNDESEWFQHNGNILKIGRSAYNSIVVLSGIEFYLTEGTYLLSFKVCNNENVALSIRTALYLSGDYPYKSLGVSFTYLLPHSSTTIIRTFTVTTAGMYYISIQPSNVGVTSWIRNVLFYNIQFNLGDPLPYEPYNQLFTAPIKKCTGKNLLDPREYRVNTEGTFENQITTQGITVIKNSDGSMTVRGTAIRNVYVYWAIGKKFRKGTYTFSTSSNDSTIQGLYVEERGTVNSSFALVGKRHATRTYTEDKKLNILCAINKGKTVDLTVYNMVQNGDTPTEYEPYREWYEY